MNEPDEKLTPIEHALAEALKMPQPQAENVLMQICKNGIKPDEKPECPPQ